MSYKPDIKDIQLSPANDIVEKLKKLNAKIRIYDPYFTSENIFGIDTESNLIDGINETDCIILVTSHKEFHDIEPEFLKSKMRTPIFIDSRCILEQKTAIEAGLIYRGLGRGIK